MLSVQLLPYLSVVTTIFLLRCILVDIPSSGSRLVMLPLVLLSLSITAMSAQHCSPNPTWNIFIGVEYGSQLALEVIDWVHLSRLYYPGAHAARWTTDLVLNKRGIRTSRQVKNVPAFDSKNPSRVPSRLQFLLFRTIRFMLSYLLIDLLTSQSVPSMANFEPGKERIFHRIYNGDLDLAGLGEVAGVLLGYGISGYIAESTAYDLFSIIAVGLGISEVADWPPLFGSITEAYTIHRFWGCVACCLTAALLIFENASG